MDVFARARGWAPRSRPVNAISGATLFLEYRAPTKRHLAGGRAFQAAGLCLGQSFAKYGAYAKREQLVEDVSAKGQSLGSPL